MTAPSGLTNLIIKQYTKNTYDWDRPQEHPTPPSFWSMSFNSESQGTSMEFMSWRRQIQTRVAWEATLRRLPHSSRAFCFSTQLWGLFTQQHSTRPVCRKPQREETSSMSERGRVSQGTGKRLHWKTNGLLSHNPKGVSNLIIHSFLKIWSLNS